MSQRPSLIEKLEHPTQLLRNTVVPQSPSGIEGHKQPALSSETNERQTHGLEGGLYPTFPSLTAMQLHKGENLNRCLQNVALSHKVVSSRSLLERNWK